MKISRRSFIKTASLGAAGLAFLPRLALAADEPAAEVLVVHGEDPARMLEVGIAKLGGWSRFVKKGQKVTLKPNAAWASKPEQGGNTNPVLVGAFVKACLEAGAKEVVLPENTCSDEKRAFGMSGIGDAVAAAGGRLYRPKKGEDYRDINLPQARSLKTARVATDVLDCDVLVNMPVAKSHGGAILTIGMKNWMGSVEDRGSWHRNNLHLCIADFSTFIHPRLVVVDATRIMITRGPQGPGDMEYPNQIIIGSDPVAVDAVAAGLFKKKPFDIPYIRLAHEMGIGCGDLERIAVSHVQA